MRLTLLRHGTAEDEHLSGRDSLRELVERGRKESRNAGWYYRHRADGRGAVPDIVLHSPYKRTTDTAWLFCEEGGFGRPEKKEFLASGMSVTEALGELEAYMDRTRVVIVGHQPDLGYLIDYLSGRPSGGTEVGKGSLHELELDRLERGAARVVYSLEARDIESMRAEG